MRIKVLEKDPWLLKDVPDHFKTQVICDKAVEDHFSSLQYVLHWFVTQEQTDAWHDDDYWYDDEMIEWYEGYKKRKAQKAKVKEGLLPIAWHPDLKTSMDKEK